jgi:Leucine-rich repeat (LRR) protein
MIKAVKKRAWRISLRALLLLVTVACIWLALIANGARRQKKAVQLILENGGRVTYDWELSPLGGRVDLVKQGPPGPTWLREFLGNDYFQTVTSASLRKSPDITLLVNLPEVVWLSLSDNGIRDISVLAKLRKLKYVNLSHNRLRDLGPLAGLNELNHIFLDDNEITDISPLLGLKQLEYLEIQHNPISQEDIEKLRAAFPNTAMSWSGPSENE